MAPFKDIVPVVIPGLSAVPIEPSAIVEPVAEKPVSAVVPPIVPLTTTGWPDAAKVKFLAPSTLLPKLMPGEAEVVTVTGPTRVTSGTDVNELAVMLLPKITSEALVKLIAPSAVVPPTTPLKAMVPVPAVAVIVWALAADPFNVLPKKMLPLPEEVFNVGVPVNVTGLEKLMLLSKPVVEMFAPKETLPTPL